MASDYFNFKSHGKSYDDFADETGTPDYLRAEHAQIVGYQDAGGRWRAITDDDWRPPTDDDAIFSEKYLIAIDTSAPGTPPNMPKMVHWIGSMEPGYELDDIYDYYMRGYTELAAE